ncbi:hypothetical protein PR048_021711 [Dryococelus australis]|uniref:Uncharacterized protein n=1 Tax=Dryococelus australis TaxID=614101 RepID=A0ABQ9GZ23_9NEOP|nr:hypothetical protein PR048_021711 [Dryococelus australis]
MVDKLCVTHSLSTMSITLPETVADGQWSWWKNTLLAEVSSQEEFPVLVNKVSRSIDHHLNKKKIQDHKETNASAAQLAHMKHLMSLKQVVFFAAELSCMCLPQACSLHEACQASHCNACPIPQDVVAKYVLGITYCKCANNTSPMSNCAANNTKHVDSSDMIN